MTNANKMTDANYDKCKLDDRRKLDDKCKLDGRRELDDRR
jgi:hypothetical protein